MHSKRRHMIFFAMQILIYKMREVNNARKKAACGLNDVLNIHMCMNICVCMCACVYVSLEVYCQLSSFCFVSRLICKKLRTQIKKH